VKVAAIRLERRALDLDPPFPAAWDPVPRTRFEATLVFVETDEGLTGIGSGDTMDGFEAFEHLFVGKDPLDVERHVRVLETIAFHAGRYWPLEAALWDIAGQVRGVPVAQLFGGKAERLPVYASTGAAQSPPERADSALALREQGFRALKLRIDRDGIDTGLATVAAVREAVGSSVEIIVDLNEGWRMPGDVRPALDFDTVRRLADELRDHDILWLEEPRPVWDVEGLANLRAATGVTLAGGEMVRTTAEFDAYLEAGALDIYQPDAVLAVGLLRAKEVAERAQARGQRYTPHTWTNGVGLLVNLHVAAGVGAAPYLEFPYDPPTWTPEQRDFLLAEPLALDTDGCLRIPDRPGLGVTLAEV
jgi:D-galactarolactone cycloisomerase